ncbi:DUF2938 domain-containing protein [Shewanella amazonensis]|uniref:DUF2938 domain-containing protein n=1 Tax=Shewanella amazonensis (strain ATCC BAA-1098 / SB2B) TaxID=326297 RepID=A1SAZ4_SHEAM|nr:DUF2938 domain-containing protein [Shewanella amazonensis]ABM01551.1 conserved hypothetical protein [Shewanella amazonensis SB2B]
MLLLLQILIIGVGATLMMDLWAGLRLRLFGVPSLNYAMVGRWLLWIPKGRFIHRPIASSESQQGEVLVGWLAHYAIGITFAGLLLPFAGAEWFTEPSAGPAVALGLVTVAAPFFLLQPVLGMGMAASRAPNPWGTRAHSLITHAVFGLGLYLSALVSKGMGLV